MLNFLMVTSNLSDVVSFGLANIAASFSAVSLPHLRFAGAFAYCTPSLGTFQRFLDIGTANGNRGFYAGQSLFATRFPALYPIAFTKPPQFRGDYFGFSDRPPMQGLLARLDGRTARARRSGVRIRKGECRHLYPITWRGICGDVACADRATTVAPQPRGA